jgi:hypothetical protein
MLLSAIVPRVPKKSFYSTPLNEDWILVRATMMINLQEQLILQYQPAFYISKGFPKHAVEVQLVLAEKHAF